MISKRNFDTKEMEVSYVNRTIKVYTESVRVMFSVWGTGMFAVVWNDEKNAPENVHVKTWEWHDDSPNSATEDATPEVLAKYEAYEVARKEREAKEKAEAEARKLERGKKVVVVRGKKVAKGTMGEVFWMGADKFNRYATRIGLKDSNGTVYWTAAYNVEVVVA